MAPLCLQGRGHTDPSISTSTGQRQGTASTGEDFSWVFPALAAAKLETPRSRRAEPPPQSPLEGGLKVWPKYQFEIVFESTVVLGRGEEERK